ncbi:endocuticle structural glycoprotein SgAbd-1 [Halyomorpha halys]|uniref:endocuticle structural glycoprotein SgAbd-1 n=1 Tax=Halyomorpha halys TaxID=286706 RepID=UPI0006D50787|nr:endocuticle structural glycoprotein SgAbd-1 [Halyomorpha halys]KAE8574009.1 Cuticle Protein CPR RR-1 [Halyomorpha halys]
MVSKVIFCALFTIVVAQRQQVQLPTHGVPATDDGDDGSWTEEKYEAPVSNDVGGRQFSAQPQYRPQPQPRYQAPAPQPQYRPQPQPQYQPPAPEPQYRPQPQAQQYDAPAPQPQYRPQQQPQAQPQYRPPAQQYRPQPQQQYSQSGDSRNAAILSEARYLQGDGKFGAAYTQEDGVEFKEESDADGTRRGTYSWVDPTGERRTVSYVAGKNGFQATGAHLPVAPAGPAASAPAPEPQYRPEPQQYQAQPEYQPRPQYRPQSQAPPSNGLYDVQSSY